MNASSSGDWDRIEGYVAVSAMVGGGQHPQPEPHEAGAPELGAAYLARKPNWYQYQDICHSVEIIT